MVFGVLICSQNLDENNHWEAVTALTAPTALTALTAPTALTALTAGCYCKKRSKVVEVYLGGVAKLWRTLIFL